MYDSLSGDSNYDDARNWHSRVVWGFKSTNEIRKKDHDLTRITWFIVRWVSEANKIMFGAIRDSNPEWFSAFNSIEKWYPKILTFFGWRLEAIVVNGRQLVRKNYVDRGLKRNSYFIVVNKKCRQRDSMRVFEVLCSSHQLTTVNSFEISCHVRLFDGMFIP